MGIWLVSKKHHRNAVRLIQEETQRGSDRSVGILIGSLVESILTEHIRGRIVDPDGDIWTQRGHPSGPFGAFAVKIDLAYMMGFITSHARADLIIMKDIRNKFAHDLDIAGFKSSAVADRCQNLKLIDLYVAGPDGKLPPDPDGRRGDSGPFRLGSGIGASAPWRQVKDPRTRFSWSAEMFVSALGRRREDSSSCI